MEIKLFIFSMAQYISIRCVTQTDVSSLYNDICNQRVERFSSETIFFIPYKHWINIRPGAWPAFVGREIILKSNFRNSICKYDK